MAAVCVTGASGFIASHVVEQLLAKGYTVHGTVRDPSNPDKTKHLKELPGADERLKLFAAELTDGPEKFEEAIRGASAVIHMATAVILNAENGEEDILKPGIAGMNAVLVAVERQAETVKTIVLTSSMAAVAPRPEPEIKTEAHWSDADGQKERKNWYGATKTLQERRLYEWQEHHKSAETPNLKDIRVVAINPTAVLGPMHQPGINATNGWFLDLFKNGKGTAGTDGGRAPNDSMSFIDVRDCAAHHIAAVELEKASGRYMSICGAPVPGREANVGQSYHWNDIFAMMKEIHPDMPDVLPCEGEPIVPTRFDLAKMSELKPLTEMKAASEMFRDLAEHFKQRQLL